MIRSEVTVSLEFVINPVLALILCTVYLVTVIAAAELLRRRRGYSNNFTRKVIHVGAGMTIWFVPFLFASPWPFVAACAVLVLFTLLDWYFGWLPAMASNDRGNLGTVYFPIAIIAVTLLFWEKPAFMVAALMPLTWGDGLAPLVGRAYGRHTYTVFGHTRSWQGSAAFFVGALAFTWLALWLPDLPSRLTPGTAFVPALLVSTVASAVEGCTVRGLDNLTVTAVAVLVFRLYAF
jgi:phytol kinase